ncbi:hypothetical protein SLEP1_g52992 [Rubroshorea leprosula]|uniref:PGG domain-containing protein n=1 Tax=Rubroshorea leprosula TaxID=152421 RepID=A0AAV5M812_9ROSI|nr:hypothetical protein SLEP1_g52992 [Rubroshorea leprosula]
MYIQDKDLLPVMATMIAAATFQAGLNPPSTIWENGVHLDNKCIITTLNYRHTGGSFWVKIVPSFKILWFHAVQYACLCCLHRPHPISPGYKDGTTSDKDFPFLLAFYLTYLSRHHFS